MAGNVGGRRLSPQPRMVSVPSRPAQDNEDVSLLRRDKSPLRRGANACNVTI